MDLRLGLSLFLFLTCFSSTQSKSTRDGPNIRQRHAKRATLSEFLQPPAPSNNLLRNDLPRDLAPPPPPPPPPSSIRTGRFVTEPSPEDRPSRGYFSRLLGWLNPWSSDGGLEPPPQSFARTPLYQEESPPSNQNGPFQNEKSCNPCNDVPWIPIRGFPPNFRDGFYQPIPSYEVRQPDYTYPQNLYPGEFKNHPIPNPHVYPGVMPPLYKNEPFATKGSYSGSQGLLANDFHHRQETSNFPIDSGGAGTNIQESVQVPGQGIQIKDKQNPAVQVQENQNQGGQEPNQNLGIQKQNHEEGIQEQNQNQGIQQQDQNLGFQKQNQDQRIQQENQNQWTQHQNQNQGIQHQNQNQEIQQQNLNPGIQEQASQNQAIQQQKNKNQGLPIQEIQGQGIKSHQNQVYQSGNQFQSQSELVPSIGGHISSEQTHFEQSPLIDLTVSSTSSSPLTFTQSVSTPGNFIKVTEASTRPSGLIEYLVSGFDERIPTTGAPETGLIGPTGTGSIGSTGTKPIGSTESSQSGPVNQARTAENSAPNGYNENQPFLEALMESYNNFKKEEALNDSKPSATNSASSGTSGEDFLLATPSSRAVKRNKQVQIIIPYTAENTPSRFQSLDEDINGRAVGYHVPRRVPFGNQFDHFNDNVLAQESKIFAVTSLPDISSSVSPSEKGKNNSIDVQRLQKNIDNWTIQEYSSAMRASTALPNITHPYLSHSKKIPNEYFTTVEPNNTSEEIYDFEDYKQMTTFEISRVTQASTSKTRTTTTTNTKFESISEEPRKCIDIEIKKNITGIGSYPSTIKSYISRIYPVFPMTSTTSKDDKVYVVTPVPTGQKESKKAVDVELKKKPKKKDPEKVERAYQVLPQAVNNLAVASTGPEPVPLWGIMEHEKFAARNDYELPILYTGHSRVSYSRR